MNGNDELTIFLTTTDIFSLDVQAIVNPVNCLGVMGSGLALSFRKRFPDMFHEYKNLCSQKQIKIGHMHLWETNSLTNPKFVINFPTKDDWKQPSEFWFIEEGLDSLVDLVNQKSLESIAIPKLGCGRG